MAQEHGKGPNGSVVPSPAARPTRFEAVTVPGGLLFSPQFPHCRSSADRLSSLPRFAPVAQLDRALPSEGKGHTFESCRVRQ